jgi:hypothetical protein
MVGMFEDSTQAPPPQGPLLSRASHELWPLSEASDLCLLGTSFLPIP